MTKWVEDKSVKFETQADVWRYLLDGGSVRSETGVIHFMENGETNLDGFCYKYPEEWTPVKKSEWYEDIPEKGVLCWISDYEIKVKKTVGIVIEYDGSFFKMLNGGVWKKAIPLTKDEVMKYIYET